MSQINNQNNNQNEIQTEEQNNPNNDNKENKDKKSNQLNEMKIALLNDFSKQKNFIINIVKIISIIASGIKELIPTVEDINSILPYFISKINISLKV